jgi:hypothetical protein
MPQALPVSRLISVSVFLTAIAAQAQSLSNLLLLGSSSVIDSVERYRTYSTLAAIATDFGTSAPEYLAANLWFQQVPQPTTLTIGKWAQAATNGVLRCAPLSAAQQALANFTAVASGGFTYTKNGGASTNVTAINLSGASTLPGVAALIQAALVATTVSWNAAYSRFEFTSTTTGATSSISFLTAPGSGTDISALLGGTAASSGAYVASGLAAETALAAVTLFDVNYGQAWYGLKVIGASDADHLAIAAYIEATNTKHLYGVTTQSAGVLVAATTTDIAYQLAALNYNKTLVQYSSSNPYAVVSAMARILTTDYTGNSTTITLMYKTEPGIVAETLNAPQADSAIAKRCNVYVSYNNGTAIIQKGVCCSGNYIDVVAAADWLAVSLQNDLYNVLYTSPTKIPQTDAGQQILVTTAEARMGQAFNNGMIGPGTWTSNGFGQLAMGDFLPKGYYVFAPKVSTQNPADRAARKSVPIQIAAKLAGAIHEIAISVIANN